MTGLLGNYLALIPRVGVNHEQGFDTFAVVSSTALLLVRAANKECG